MVARRLRAVFDQVLNASAYFCGVMLLIMTFSICYEVLMRHILGKPTSWVVDVSSFILVYITFLAAAWVLRDDRHVNVEIVMTHLQPKVKTTVNCFTSILAMLACIIFSWKAWELAWLSYQSRSKFYGGIVVPEYIILWPVFFGSCLLSIMFALKAWQYFHAPGSSLTKEPKSENL